MMNHPLPRTSGKRRIGAFLPLWVSLCCFCLIQVGHAQTFNNNTPQLNGSYAGNIIIVPRVAVVPVNWGGGLPGSNIGQGGINPGGVGMNQGGISYVTRQTPTWQNATVARQFFIAGGIGASSWQRVAAQPLSQGARFAARRPAVLVAKR